MKLNSIEEVTLQEILTLVGSNTNTTLQKQLDSKSSIVYNKDTTYQKFWICIADNGAFYISLKNDNRDHEPITDTNFEYWHPIYEGLDYTNPLIPVCYMSHGNVRVVDELDMIAVSGRHCLEVTDAGSYLSLDKYQRFIKLMNNMLTKRHINKIILSGYMFSQQLDDNNCNIIELVVEDSEHTQTSITLPYKLTTINTWEYIEKSIPWNSSWSKLISCKVANNDKCNVTNYYDDLSLVLSFGDNTTSINLLPNASFEITPFSILETISTNEENAGRIKRQLEDVIKLIKALETIVNNINKNVEKNIEDIKKHDTAIEQRAIAPEAPEEGTIPVFGVGKHLENKYKVGYKENNLAQLTQQVGQNWTFPTKVLPIIT